MLNNNHTFDLAIRLSNELQEPAFILQRENGEHKVTTRPLHELNPKLKLLATILPGLKSDV